MQDHSSHSSLREKMLEQMFMAEVMRELWRRGSRDFEVLHATTDTSGFDVAVEAWGILRHIQLKSSHSGAKTAVQKINSRLECKPSGCVVWMRFDPDSMQFNGFLWYGGPAGAPLPALPEKLARHTKGDQTGYKAARPAIRILNKGAFTAVPDTAALVDLLFGAA